MRIARALPVLLLALVASSARAQSLIGTITGVVKDPQGNAMPGATVALTGPAGTVNSTTDKAGEFRFPAVDPGTYALRVELAGFRRQQREQIVIHPGERLTIDFLMSVGGLTDSVEVVAETPVIDVRSSAFRISLPQQILFNVPLTRIASDLVDATPGSNINSAYGAGSSVANALYLDGVDTRDPGDQGLFISLDYTLIDEIQIEGPGAPAEYGAFTGAVVNTVTRSGGNRLAGLFEARVSGKSLASDNVSPEQVVQNPNLADSAVTDSLVNLTAQLSGPIVRDKLFFLLNVRGAEIDIDPSGPRTTREESDHGWNGKLTWDAGPEDHLALLLQHDTSRIRGLGFASDTDALTQDYWHPETSWNLQWRHLFGTQTFLEAKYAGWSGKFEYAPKTLVPLHFDVATGDRSGSSGYTQTSERRRHQASVAVSHHAAAFGKHDLKFGLEIERSHTRDRVGYVDGVEYLDYAGQPYQAYSYSADLAGRTERDSAYVQDGWQPMDRLTINLGGRLDLYRGGDGADTLYEARGLAPRVGLTYELGADGRAAVRASYGRYYEALPVAYFYPALPGTSDRITYDNTGPSLVEVHRTPAALLATVDPELRHPHVDEVTLGMERALPMNVRFLVTGIWRRTVDFLDDLHLDARFEPVTVVNSLTGAPLIVYRWTNPSVLDESAIITNADGFRYLDPQGQLLGTAEAFRKYRCLMVVLSRRLEGRWQAQVSYVLAKAEGTVENSYFGSAGPTASNFTSPNFGLVNAKGQLVYDFRHEVKVLASYRVPRLELGLNAYFRLVSGTTYAGGRGFSEAVTGVGDGVLLEPRGSRRLPTQTILDLRIERSFGVGRGTLGPYADVTNAFNANPATFTVSNVQGRSINAHHVAFGAPLAILPPRQVVLGARWSF